MIRNGARNIECHAQMDRETVEKLYRKVERGKSIRAAADDCGISVSTAFRLLAENEEINRRRGPAPLTRLEIVSIMRLSDDGENSIRRISGHVSRSWHAVARVLRSHQRVAMARVYRCPDCGNKVTFRPCIVCRANHAKQSSTGTKK